MVNSECFLIMLFYSILKFFSLNIEVYSIIIICCLFHLFHVVIVLVTITGFLCLFNFLYGFFCATSVFNTI